METVTAVIPARSGSRRLPGKNLAAWGGTTLLEHKIQQLLRLKGRGVLDRVVVSSDSQEYLAIAENAGADVQLRDPEWCDEVSKPFGAVVEHIVSRLDTQHVMWACCTSPLVETRTYATALEHYFDAVPELGDSLVSVEVLRRYVWNESGPVNYRLGLAHVPSQQLPPLYIITDGILIAKRTDMLRWRYFHGPRPWMFRLDKRQAVDVDDALDLAQALAWRDEDLSGQQLGEVG